MLWGIKGVREYQVIQKRVNNIQIFVVLDEKFDDECIQDIGERLGLKSRSWSVDIKIVDKIDRTRAGKYRWIINEIGRIDMGPLVISNIFPD